VLNAVRPAGASLTRVDPLQRRCPHHRADNGNAPLANRTRPSGAVAEEHRVAAAVKHTVSDRGIGRTRFRGRRV
jgi:hypothetical protein